MGSAFLTWISKRKTHCSILKCLFSTPVWFALIRFTAMTRSSGVKNHAFVGESGKKNLQVNINNEMSFDGKVRAYQYITEVTSVIAPVIIINHCQGANPPVWM